MKKLLNLFFATHFLTGCLTLYAADLLGIYQEAKMQDALFASAKAQFIAAQEILPQSKAVLQPEAEFQADSTWNRIDFEAKTGNSFVQDFGDHQAGLTVTQPIYRPQLSIGVEQARIQLMIAESKLEVASQDLLLRVAQLYFRVLQKNANLAAVEAEKIAVSEQLEQAKRNFLVGTATVTDQREAQARYDLVLAQELGAENELAVANSQLEVLLGRQVDDDLEKVTLPIDLPGPYPVTMAAWVKKSHETNLNVLIAQRELALAQYEVQKQTSEYKPTVDAVGSHTFSDQGFSSFGKYSAQSTVFGIRFKLPLYKGGAINSRIKEAVAKQESVRQQLEAERRRSAQRTTESFLGVTSGLAQVKALEQAVASTQLQLESTKLGQEVGVRTAVDVLNAEQQLSKARRDLYNAVYSTILAQLGLKAAVGQLSETDIGSVNKLLE